MLGAASCGGGGGSGDPGIVLTNVFSGTYLSHVEDTVRVVGRGMYPLGGTATIQIRARQGTPFENGTTDRLDVAALVDSEFQVRGTLLATRVETDVTADVDVMFSDGRVLSAPAPIEITAQRLETFSPGTVDGSRNVPFVITGVGLAPVGTSVEVVFDAPAGSPFHVGTGRSGQLRATGSIQSSTEIHGLTPYAGVLAATSAAVTITLTGGDQISAPGTPAMFVPGNAGVRGTWEYERVAITDTGLDYSDVSSHPIRSARVQLIKAGSGNVITTRTTDDSGAYQIDYSIPGTVCVRVLAETDSTHTPIRVQDNTSGGAVWASEGAPLGIQNMWNTRDYVAELGWMGAAYGPNRGSGPFALMDTAYEAAETIRDARPATTFQQCVINWSPENVPQDGQASLGEIGGPHYDGELWFLGKDGIETDEFDVPLIIHEWGHYLTDKLSRDDSPGGTHSYGDFKQPTLAFSEGFATALSAMLNDPDFIYRDTFGPGQSQMFALFDMQDSAVDAPNAGWFSEQSIIYLATDLYDSDTSEAWDGVSLGLGPIIDAIAGDVKNTQSLTTVFSFIRSLKTANPAAALDIDALCQHHSFGPVLDEWGSSEANAGDAASNLPVFFPGTVGMSGQVFTMFGDHSFANDLRASRFIRVPSSGGLITVQATTAQPGAFIDDHDIAVYVYHKGGVVASADDLYYGTESLSFASTAGETYVIELFSLSFLPGSFNCTLSVQ